MHILRRLRGVVLRGDRHYVRGDANWMGHQGQQVPQPRNPPLLLSSTCFGLTVSAFPLKRVWFVCDRRAMGSGMTSTRAHMMAAGSSSGTTLAVNLTLILAGRKVCPGHRCLHLHFQTSLSDV